MNYTIVFESGNIQRLISIATYHVSKDYIVFFAKDSEKTFTYPRDRIASIVFYP